mgnify:CR=1 FL=1|jgi:hypothetical protein
MMEHFAGQLREGMDVFDVDGEKIGTIGEVYPADTLGETAMTGATTTAQEGHLKVDTGFLGLGKDLYIPFSAIREVTADGVYLNVEKEGIDGMGWDVAPAYLRERGYGEEPRERAY